MKSKVELPICAEIWCLAVPEEGDWFLDFCRKPRLLNKGECCAGTYPILKFTHGYGYMPLNEVPIPKGYEPINGEAERSYRVAERGETYLSRIGDVRTCEYSHSVDRCIVLKKTTKQYLTMVDIEIFEGPGEAPNGTIRRADAVFWVNNRPDRYKIIEK